MKTCPNCQLEFDDKFGYCPKCGGVLKGIIEKAFCPYCGKKIETDGEYCPYCGKALFDTVYSKQLNENSTNVGLVEKPIENRRQNGEEKAVLPEVNFKKNYVKMVPLQKKENKNENNDNDNDNESTSKSVFKLILYIIGAFVLFFTIKVIGQGVATAAIRNGYGVHFVVLCLILVPVGMYFRNKY